MKRLLDKSMKIFPVLMWMFLCQLETYKEDFEIEKKEKEQLAQECCKLRRQLEVAQVENKAAVRQVRPHWGFFMAVFSTEVLIVLSAAAVDFNLGNKLINLGSIQATDDSPTRLLLSSAVPVQNFRSLIYFCHCCRQIFWSSLYN